jgi:Holliday junction resolvase RusA-like endonuclease
MKIILPFQPIPASRVQTPRWGKSYYSTTYQDYRARCDSFFSNLEEPKVWYGNLYPCTVAMSLHGPRRGSDIDNHMKAVLDSLVRNGVLRNDTWEDVQPVARAIPEKNPADRKTIITITYGFIKWPWG